MEKILILGGTSFIGRNLVETLIDRDEYEITLFNRGVTNKHLFPTTETIYGDRQTNDIEQIKKQSWNYIIDVSCFYPNDLKSILSNLTSKPNKYIFISTCSVYDNEKYSTPLRNENSPILTCTREQAIDTTLNTYGQRKAACEKVLADSGINYLIFRPALVYGSYDPTDRFYYWLNEVKKRKTLLLPEKGIRRFSITYVHDLVAAIINSINSKTTSKIFNVTTVETSINQIVRETQNILDQENEFINATAAFLKTEKISQWSGIPLWLNTDYFTYDNSRLTAELLVNPTCITESIIQTIDYYDSINWPKPTFGISEQKKKELISKIGQ